MGGTKGAGSCWASATPARDSPRRRRSGCAIAGTEFVPRIVARRKGFVLAAALLALLMIAALVAGAIFAANEGTRMAVASADRQLTLAAAESSIEEAMLSDDASEWTGAIGGSTASTQQASSMPVTIYRTRLDTKLVWIGGDAGPARAG